ncbi:MAG: GIY-YIG nuclease family protein [Methanothrix sp.]|jgi:hypothetical protein|nr:GIY-YIG nuclease family protein [Methanothrix sp.]
MNFNNGYYWIRIYDFKKDQVKVDFEDDGKGTLLDEYYLKDISSREEAKDIVKSRSNYKNLLFRRPKNQDGVYAIVMDSDQFFYDRFMIEIDSYCFWHECHKKINGKKMFFPSRNIDDNNIVHFCSYDCLKKFETSLYSEGEFQEKEEGEKGNVYGYIYQIYNRETNKYYVGQTKYLPFFRWQEHIKEGEKGHITDLVFLVLSEVRREYSLNNIQLQTKLNDMEAWWIQKLSDQGLNTMNISKPKLTLEEMKEKYNKIVKGEIDLFDFE